MEVAIFYEEEGIVIFSWESLETFYEEQEGSVIFFSESLATFYEGEGIGTSFSETLFSENLCP